MKMLSAKVVDGKLDVPAGTLQEGVTVTILVPEDESGVQLSEDQRQELRQAIAEADRAEGVDGWELLDELRQR